MNTSPTRRAVTQQYDFCLVSAGSQKLFSVRGGVPLKDALDQLSVYLSSVQSVVEVVATSDDESASVNWAVSQMIEFTQALVQSMHGGLVEHEKATGGGEA